MRQRRQKKEGTGGTVKGKNIICEEKYERKLRRTFVQTDLAVLLPYSTWSCRNACYGSKSRGVSFHVELKICF